MTSSPTHKYTYIHTRLEPLSIVTSALDVGRSRIRV